MDINVFSSGVLVGIVLTRAFQKLNRKIKDWRKRKEPVTIWLMGINDDGKEENFPITFKEV